MIEADARFQSLGFIAVFACRRGDPRDAGPLKDAVPVGGYGSVVI
ncbi:MAG: hypothetical protein VX701_04150 [Chloroflexota bacterium]|nr:hypothetical protein [Chloroflexota bacterium]